MLTFVKKIKHVALFLQNITLYIWIGITKQEWNFIVTQVGLNFLNLFRAVFFQNEAKKTKASCAFKNARKRWSHSGSGGGVYEQSCIEDEIKTQLRTIEGRLIKRMKDDRHFTSVLIR